MRTNSRYNVIAAFLILTLVFAALAASAAGKKVTVKGEMVCLSCYLGHGGEGPEHASCAKSCASKGLPMGLKSGSKVYVLVEDHANSAAYKQAVKLAGAKVTAVGNASTKSGVTGLAVTSIKKS